MKSYVPTSRTAVTLLNVVKPSSEISTQSPRCRSFDGEYMEYETAQRPSGDTATGVEYGNWLGPKSSKTAGSDQVVPPSLEVR